MRKLPKKFQKTVFLTDSKKFPIFEHKGKKFLSMGVDLETNLVTVKNLDSGNIKDIDFDKLNALIGDTIKPQEIPCKSCSKALSAVEFRNSPIKLLCKKCLD